GLQGQGFRLDIEGDDIDDEALADHIVRDLRLLMVGAVRILNKEIIVEPHKRAAGARAARDGGVRERLIDLSHVVESGVVTYRGLPAPVVCDYLSREASREQIGRASCRERVKCWGAAANAEQTAVEKVGEGYAAASSLQARE